MKVKNLILIHLFYWMVFLFNILLKDGFSGDDFQNPLSWSGLLVNLLAFYLNYFLILPYFIYKKKFKYILPAFILAFFIFIFLRFSIEELLMPAITGYSNYAPGTTIQYYIFDNFYWGSNTIFISSLIWFLDYAFKIKAENHQLTEDKKLAEISLLKSQINPHFIFNTLNNIYALVNIKSDKALNAIDQLSQLLRFSSAEMTRDFTLLINETKYIESLIALESLRFAKLENINFERTIKDESVEIAPMLLIPFIENAFKHGNIKEFPLVITLESTKSLITFMVRNKISDTNKDQSSGIGIENVKRRLALIYPERHQLKITENDGFHKVELLINV